MGNKTTGAFRVIGLPHAFPAEQSAQQACLNRALAGGQSGQIHTNILRGIRHTTSKGPMQLPERILPEELRIKVQTFLRTPTAELMQKYIQPWEDCKADAMKDCLNET